MEIRHYFFECGMVTLEAELPVRLMHASFGQLRSHPAEDADAHRKTTRPGHRAQLSDLYRKPWPCRWPQPNCRTYAESALSLHPQKRSNPRGALGCAPARD